MKRTIPILVAALLTTTLGIAHAEKQADSKPAKAKVALEGYCPVAYVEMGKAMKGNPKVTSTLDGHKYYFANADAKKMFDADPAKYRVAYNGYCATAVSMGKKLKSKPTLFTVHEGSTYLFSNADAKKMFDADAEGVIAKSDAAWVDLSK